MERAGLESFAVCKGMVTWVMVYSVHDSLIFEDTKHLHHLWIQEPFLELQSPSTAGKAFFCCFRILCVSLVLLSLEKGTATHSSILWLSNSHTHTHTQCYSSPRGASVKESACQGRRHRRHWVRKIPWRRKWHLIPVFLPGKSHGQRSLAGYSPWGRKESDTTEPLNTLTLVYF